jgi:dolichol-phosphate mannosyltransferase
MTSIPPLCDISEFHSGQAACALIIGVYNEGEKFTRQIASLQPYRAQVDIIIVDGGSADGASSAEALQGHVRTLIVNRDVQRGLSVQYRAALHYALEQGYEAVIMMDGNGKDGGKAIPGFIEKLRQGYDFVQGSRFLPGGHHANTPLDRVLGIRFVFTPIMHIASGFRYTDAMNGFKGCSRAFLSDPRVQPFRSVFVRYSLQYYLNYIAPRLGMRVVEIPVSRSYPSDGAPYSKIGGLWGRVKILAELFNP